MTMPTISFTSFDVVLKLTIDGRKIESVLELRCCVSCGALVPENRVQPHANFHGRIGS